MPDPQPAWAQQYNYDMQPIWARRFEPAAITGSESQDAILALMKIYRQTGEKKYLAPIPRAMAYLKRSQLSDGRLARYYELQSNKPLYMQRSGDVYTLTYDDSNLPDHYGWKIDSRLDEIESEYTALIGGKSPATSEPAIDQLKRQVQQIIKDQDEQGRWFSIYRGERLVGQPKFAPNSRYISSAVFSENIELLSQYLISTK